MYRLPVKAGGFLVTAKRTNGSFDARNREIPLQNIKFIIIFATETKILNMEFIALFFTISALAFVLWLMAVAVLFLIKVAIGTTGALYYSIKGLADFLLKLLDRITRILHIEGIFKTMQDKLPLRQ